MDLRKNCTILNGDGKVVQNYRNFFDYTGFKRAFNDKINYYDDKVHPVKILETEYLLDQELQHFVVWENYAENTKNTFWINGKDLIDLPVAVHHNSSGKME